MNIGFDLDKIFIDYPPFIPDKIIDKLYKKKANGILLYRIPSKPEQILRNLSHLSILRPPIHENIAFLKKIPKDKNKIYLISSRFGFLKTRTEKLMKEQGFDKIFDGMYFNFDNKQPHEFKNDIINKLHIDLYVDDDLHLLRYAAKQNPKTKFFWLNPTFEKKAITKNITAISKLSDMLTN
jgi:hypothetical protein